MSAVVPLSCRKFTKGFHRLPASIPTTPERELLKSPFYREGSARLSDLPKTIDVSGGFELGNQHSSDTSPLISNI